MTLLGGLVLIGLGSVGSLILVFVGLGLILVCCGLLFIYKKIRDKIKSIDPSTAYSYYAYDIYKIITWDIIINLSSFLWVKAFVSCHFESQNNEMSSFFLYDQNIKLVVVFNQKNEITFPPDSQLCHILDYKEIIYYDDGQGASGVGLKKHSAKKKKSFQTLYIFEKLSNMQFELFDQLNFLHSWL